MLTRLSVAMAALLIVPSFARADGPNIARDAGPFELTISGSGQNDNKFNNGGFTLGGSFGWFFTPNFELFGRDTVTYNDNGGGSAYSNNARAGVDFHLNFDRFQPFIGGNIGYVSGDFVKDTPTAAPEGGIKFFLGEHTFLLAMVEYDFFWHSGDNGVTSTAQHGQFVYNVGLGFRF
jgi:hypothetical protein